MGLWGWRELGGHTRLLLLVLLCFHALVCKSDCCYIDSWALLTLQRFAVLCWIWDSWWFLVTCSTWAGN